MTLQPGQQIITIHILPNNSQSKDNQAMKFGQVIEDNKRNMFFKKIIQKKRQGNYFQTSFYFLKRLYMR